MNPSIFKFYMIKYKVKYFYLTTLEVMLIMKYKTIDLCAGIGGMRKGFELTNKFENIISAEIDDSACETYKHLYGDNPKHDLTESSFKEKIYNLNFDVMLAGFPCQTFSAVGTRKGFDDDEKGIIFSHLEEILKNTRPKAFLLENVTGLLSNDKGRTIKHIFESLSKNLDYHIIGLEGLECYNKKFKISSDKTEEIENIKFKRANFVRNTRDFGLPQNRPRVFIVGFDKKRYSEKLESIPYNELPLDRNKDLIYSNLSKIFDLGKVAPDYYMAQGYLDTLIRHKEREKKKGNGFGYVVLNDPIKPSQVANTLLATGGSGKERNLIIDYKADYIGLNIKQKRTPLNSKGIRTLTEEEWAKLQGFKGYAFIDPKTGEDKFSFPEGTSKGQKYKQLGNSVSIPVIEEIAKMIYKNLDYLEKK